MRVYYNRVPIPGKEFPLFIFKNKGRFFLKMIGINTYIDDKGLDVSPIYAPLFSYEKVAGQITVQVAWKGDYLTLFLYSTRPYIWLGMSNRFVLEDE